MRAPMICVIASFFLLGNTPTAAQGVLLEGKKYAYAREIKCQVKKAIPAPEKGPTWYMSGDIGDVWMKFTPTEYAPGAAPATKGTILIYRTDRVYKELMTYPDSWWTWPDESELVEGTAKSDIRWDNDQYENPFYFKVNRIEEQGMFHGSDGKPKYLLSDCRILDALVRYPTFKERYEELFPEPPPKTRNNTED